MPLCCAAHFTFVGGKSIKILLYIVEMETVDVAVTLCSHAHTYTAWCSEKGLQCVEQPTKQHPLLIHIRTHIHTHIHRRPPTDVPHK